MVYPGPPSSPPATKSCHMHSYPWWSSSRAASRPSARSKLEQSDLKKRCPKSAVIQRRPDLAVSGLWEALCSSVSVPTHTAVAGAVVPAITVLIWSPLDGTRHSDLLNRTRPRAGFEPSISTHAEHKRTVLRPTVGRHSLGSGRLPGRTGAGAGSALTWPRSAATLGPWLDPSVSSIRKPYVCVLSTVRH